jgi:hypothetical protein
MGTVNFKVWRIVNNLNVIETNLHSCHCVIGLDSSEETLCCEIVLTELQYLH